MTPAEYVAAHPLTAKLRERGYDERFLATVELSPVAGDPAQPFTCDPEYWPWFAGAPGFDLESHMADYALLQAFARLKWAVMNRNSKDSRTRWHCSRLSELVDRQLMPDVMRAIVHSDAGKRGKGKPRPGRRSPVRDALRLLVAEGLDNAAILRELGDADAIASRARHGFPIEVCDPETTLADDDVLRWYLPGGDYENPETYPLATLIKALSEIRNSA